MKKNADLMKWVRNPSVTVRLTLEDGRQLWSKARAEYVAPDHIVVHENAHDIKEVLADQVAIFEPFRGDGILAI